MSPGGVSPRSCGGSLAQSTFGVRPPPPGEASLDDLRELEIDGLCVKIDRMICVGFEDCIQEAPATFALDGDGVAEFTETAAGTERERLLAAARSCPVDAIVIVDESNNQVHPSRSAGTP